MKPLIESLNGEIHTLFNKQMKLLCFKCLKTPSMNILKDIVTLNCECGYNESFIIKEFLNKNKNFFNDHQCEFDSDNAEMYCVECEQWLCSHCSLLHKKSKVLKNHHTTLQNDLIIPLCENHKNEREWYCINCKDYYCSLCYDEHDKSHSGININSIISKKQFQVQLEEVKKGEEYLTHYYNQIKSEYIKKIETAKAKNEEMNRNILQLLTIVINGYTQSNNYYSLMNIKNIITNMKIELNIYKEQDCIISFFNNNYIVKTKEELNQQKRKIVKLDGRQYEGEIKNDKFNGIGRISYPDGAKYEGEWKDDNRNDYGIFIYPNGRMYEGEWKDDKRNGYGIESYPDGKKFEGEWIDDKRKGS